MWRVDLCVWLATLALMGASAQPAALSEDARLHTCITVWLKLEPLRDALRMIGRQVGVPLRCTDAIAQEKVCIFVEDRPAHEVLTQLTRLMRYEWHPHEEGGYIVRVPEPVRLEEERAQNQMRRARLSALRELRHQVREILKLPADERIQERERLMARHAELNDTERLRLKLLEPLTAFAAHSVAPDGTIRYHEGYGYWSSDAYAYVCLAALPDRALHAVLDGQWIGLSTQPAQGVYRFPEVPLPNLLRDHTALTLYTERELRHILRNVSPSNPEFAGMWLKLLPLHGTVEYRLLSVPRMKIAVLDSDGNVVQGSESEPFSAVRSISSSTLLPWNLRETDSSLWRYWDMWATPKSKLRSALPERPAPAPHRAAFQPQPYFAGQSVGYRYTSADALEWLAWATRRPVLSDAFRTAHLEPILKPDLSPRALLQPLHERVWLRIDDAGYLMARHKRYWELRLFEIPESWLRPLERKAEQNADDLWDYVALAGKLSKQQVDYLMQSQSHANMPLTRFPIQSLIDCLPALRFLASLSEGQRRLLATGEPLHWSRLNRSQQTRYLEALRVDFPPAQWLFREPMPAQERTLPSTLQNLTTSLVVYVLDDETPERLEARLKTPPAESLVRLTRCAELAFPVLVAPEGYYDRYFVGYAATGEDAEATRTRAIRDMHKALQEASDRRLVQLRVRGYLIEFFTSDSRFARYAFALAREEPFSLPPLPPTEQEP
ncbi:MAG: hypothetical protein NZ874_05540 [Fimbriimonadales bacterium]|nr:hypothetical protein [Fimbriimonadales bacterium]